MTPRIVRDRIDGTRITVWDVFLYLNKGRSVERIAGVLPLTVEQVQVAIDYIDENREYVLEGHRRIEERNAQGNSPEVEAKLQQSRAKMQAWLDQRRKEHIGAGNVW